MMDLAVDGSNVDSDDNFHNKDWGMTVEAVIMIPTISLHVTSGKSTMFGSVVSAGDNNTGWL